LDLHISIPDKDLDFLGAGETLTATYDVTVADGAAKFDPDRDRHSYRSGRSAGCEPGNECCRGYAIAEIADVSNFLPAPEPAESCSVSPGGLQIGKRIPGDRERWVRRPDSGIERHGNRVAVAEIDIGKGQRSSRYRA
jgi:hypothetical protein